MHTGPTAEAQHLCLMFRSVVDASEFERECKRLYSVENFCKLIYDYMNDFSLIKYLDFLILKDYVTNATQISKFKFQNIGERKKQLKDNSAKLSKYTIYWS